MNIRSLIRRRVNCLPLALALTACSGTTAGSGAPDAATDAATGDPTLRMRIDYTCVNGGVAQERNATDFPGKKPSCTVKPRGQSFAVSAAVFESAENFWDADGWPAEGETRKVSGGLTLTADCGFIATECTLTADDPGMGVAAGRAWANVSCIDGKGNTATGFIKLENCKQQ